MKPSCDLNALVRDLAAHESEAFERWRKITTNYSTIASEEQKRWGEASRMLRDAVKVASMLIEDEPTVLLPLSCDYPQEATTP